MGKIVKIDDVARASGVSKATVSRVINRPNLVADSTRRRINKVIRQLGFSPNHYARGLSGMPQTTVGLLFLEDFSELAHNPFWALATNAVHAALSSHGISSQIFAYQPKNSQGNVRQGNPGELDFLQSREVGGFITIGTMTDDFYSHLVNAQRPVMIWGPPHTPVNKVSAVDSNNLGGAALAVSHLFSRGYRKIAHISGPPGLKPAADRLEGYRRQSDSLKLEFEPRWIQRGDGTFDSGYELTKRLLSLRDAPDAIFCLNDEVAFGSLAFADDTGVNVPGQLAIVGFDNIASEMKILRRRLTSVSHAYTEIGDSLAQGIRALINDEPFRARILDTYLFEGETT